MISAIAARKAAQAAQNTSSRGETSVLTQSTPSAPSSTANSSNSTKTLKRKQNSNHDSAIPKIKKKKTQKKHSAPQGRYFQEPEVFQGQDGLIVVDSDDGDGDVSDERITEQDPIIADPDVEESLVPPPKNRAWSPSRPVNDSSDNEDIGSFFKPSQSYQNASELASDLSTYHAVPEQNLFYLTADETSSLGLSTSFPCTLLALHVEETVALVGTYRLTVLSGRLSLCGVALDASPRTHNVFAPRSSPLPILKACYIATKSSWQPPSALGRLKDIVDGSETVFVLQELRTNVEGLGSVCRTFENVFRPHRFADIGSPDLRLAGVDMVINASKYIHPFVTPRSWDTALGDIQLPDPTDSIATLASPVLLVKGPKKSGKSSFAKSLLNRLLQRYRKVAYLECDIGQSEFTPGGMVALNIIEQPVFGPPFTHPTLPNQAHFIGALTPRTSPSHYLATIQSLIQYYHLDVQTPVDISSSTVQDSRIVHSIPLVVNTMGWTKGLGADLTVKIEELVQPTHVFEFETPVYDGGRSNIPLDANPLVEGYGATPCRQFILEPITPSANYSAVDHRIITLLSYFHAVFPNRESASDELTHDLKEGLRQITACSWNVSLPLCAMPPFEVDVSSVIDRVYLSGVGSEDIVCSEIERILNGAVVGLVSYEAGTLEVDGMDVGEDGTSRDTTLTAIPYLQGSNVPSPLTSTSHGLALIRSVSPGGSSIHVLTPVPSGLLARSRVLVKGEMELPVWGMLDFRSWDKDGEGTVAGVSRGKVPYLQWGKGEGLGADKRRVRRNLMRKAQM